MEESKIAQLITELKADMVRGFDTVATRLDDIDKRLTEHDERFDDLNKRLGSQQVRNDDQFMRLYRHIETRCDTIEALMATKVQTEQLIEMVDGVAKVVESDHVEVTSITAKMERIKARIHRLENHTPQLRQDAA
ncbi:methyl-accepting chemotaxis protein [Kibdelosporangium banguiense]|uniref:Methyl-accepting chemotaxis protein n=1 Tax=Kibdelosporangium banguiense TaxID=1365924 RepID=A0ABS4TFN7_9PSEU|nr:hypothetical protein [Kibdelosporangium banguiense]MBP2322646.1 methyl-accepting chemotaxis protein [Kibdelosporangium banguiense]